MGGAEGRCNDDRVCHAERGQMPVLVVSVMVLGLGWEGKAKRMSLEELLRQEDEQPTPPRKSGFYEVCRALWGLQNLWYAVWTLNQAHWAVPLNFSSRWHQWGSAKKTRPHRERSYGQRRISTFPLLLWGYSS